MITHPEKVLFPDDGITKGELARYYERVAPLILPHVRGRPMNDARSLLWMVNQNSITPHVWIGSALF